MQVDQQFLDKLRYNLRDQLQEDGTRDNSDANIAGVLACFDRAALATVLNGSEPSPPKPNKRPKAGSQAAKDRARKAAETRRNNREKSVSNTLLGQGGGE